MRTQRRRTVVAIVVAALLASILAAPSLHAALPYVASEEYFPSVDGTMLHAYVFRPAGAEHRKTPVIVNVTPYANWMGDALGPNPTNMAAPTWGDDTAFTRGYSTAIVSLRGTGGSGGCLDLYGPGEIADAHAAVEHFADAPWSTGKVGIVGTSYDGFTAIAALATGARGLAAVVAGAPPTGYQNFYMNGVRDTGGGHGFGALYVGGDLMPPGPFAPSEQNVNALNGSFLTNPACYANVLAGPYLNTHEDDPYWRVRELQAQAGTSKVPVIWRQGFNDWQVRPTGFVEAFSHLRGPKIGIFGPWDHGPPRHGDVNDQLNARWLDHYLLGKPMPKQPAAMVQSFDGTWRTEDAWPPRDAKAFALPIKPGTYMDLPGNNGETGLPAAFGTEPPVPLPTGKGMWTFTPPLPYDAHVAGVGLVTANVRTLLPGAHLVGILYDVDPKGAAQMVSRGVTELGSSGRVAFDLYPQDWRFAKGHRIGLLVSAADDIFFEPPITGQPVDVVSGSYSLPFLHTARTPNLKEGPFDPREPHPPFMVDAATISSQTMPSALPPRMRPAR